MQDVIFSKGGIIQFLRRAFPTATALHVSAATGISASTIDKWLRGVSAPSAAHVGTLADCFGPSFLAVAYPVAKPWLEGRVHHEKLETALTELRSALAGIAR